MLAEAIIVAAENREFFYYPETVFLCLLPLSFHSSFYLSNCFSICLSVSACLCVCLPLSVSVCVPASICLSVSLSVCLSPFFLSYSAYTCTYIYVVNYLRIYVDIASSLTNSGAPTCIGCGTLINPQRACTGRVKIVVSCVCVCVCVFVCVS